MPGEASKEEEAALISTDGNNSLSDRELLAQAEELAKEDRVSEALEVFQQVTDTSLFTDEHKHAIYKGELMEKVRLDVLNENQSDGWTKQGESHGDRDFNVYYKMVSKGNLSCKIETAMEESLFIPFVSVLNESELYEETFPLVRFPSRGIRRSLKLRQCSRVEQLVQLTLDLPCPIKSREVLFHGLGDDRTEKDRMLAAKLITVNETFQGEAIPPPEKRVQRMDMEMNVLFRPCPPDHPLLAKSKGKYANEKKILVTFVCWFDPKIPFVPQPIMNFVTRFEIGTVWKLALGVAEDIRAGKPDYQNFVKLIEEKHELYDWARERVRIMLQDLE